MKRCLIWGIGLRFVESIRVIQYYEQCGQIKIVGTTSNESYYDSILGYPFVDKDNIDINAFDILIVIPGGKVFSEITREAKQKGIAEERIVPIRAMELPGFDFDKYIQIKMNVPTIFCPNCWGGLTYNSLGLEFKSPFINMFMTNGDYIKLLKNPRHYMNQTVIFERIEFDNYLQKNYPVGRCDDILLHFNHYSTFDEAMVCWERRKNV